MLLILLNFCWGESGRISEEVEEICFVECSRSGQGLGRMSGCSVSVSQSCPFCHPSFPAVSRVAISCHAREVSPPSKKKKKKKKEKCSFNPSFVLILGIFRTVGGLGELLWDRDTGLCHLLLKVTLFHPCSLLRMGEKSKLNSWRRGERSQVNVELLERAGVTSGVK